jgi:hypothetical protein
MQQPHAAMRVAEKSTRVGTSLERGRYFGGRLKRRRRAKRARRGVNGICVRFIPERRNIFDACVENAYGLQDLLLKRAIRRLQRDGFAKALFAKGERVDAFVRR